MQFPRYEAHDYPEQSPVDAYISFVATETEAGFDYGERISDVRRRLLAASRFIGQACLRVVEDERQGDEELRIAQAYARPATRWEMDGLRSQARLLMTTAEIIRSRHQPERLALMRATQHMQVMDELAGVYGKLDDGALSRKALGEARGQATEFTALALLTRLADRDALAVPALPHQDYVHDSHLNGRGFDMLFVRSPAAGQTAGPPETAYKIQVKSGCLGYCQEEMHALGRKIADGYASDTILLSGCCDLGETAPGGYGTPPAMPLTGLLLAEAEGGLDSGGVGRLNESSNRLLSTITGDGRRRGTFASRVERVLPPAVPA